MPDWKKEIKLSDFFKRGSKPGADDGVEAPTKSVEKTRALKKEIHLFKRKPKAEQIADVSVDATAGPPAEPSASAAEKASAGRKPMTFLKRKPKDPDFEHPKPEKARQKPAAAIPAVPLMRAFNLLPKEDVRQTSQRPATAKLVLVVVSAVAVMGLGAAFMIVNAQLADRKAQHDELTTTLNALIAEQQARVAALEPGDDPTLVQEEQARTTALATALGKRVAWDRLLRDVSLVLPSDVWLQGFLASSPPPVDPASPIPTVMGSTLTINGSTRDQAGVARFLARLETLPELSSVQLLSSAAVDQNGETVVQFSITAQVKPPTGASA